MAKTRNHVTEERGEGKKPPVACSECKGKEFVNVTETEKQWTGYCKSCGLQHVTGFPASVKVGNGGND